MRRLLRPCLVIALGLLAVPSAPAQTAGGPMAQRLAQLQALFAAEPHQPEELFHAAFLAQVPAARLAGIFSQYHGQGGAVAAVATTAAKGEFAGEYRFTTVRGMSFPVTLAVDPAPPHLITGLWLGPMSAGLASPEAALAALRELPGQVSFAFCRLGDGGPEPVHALEPDLPLAMGSAFKLYVLGALVGEVAAGQRAWDDVVALRPAWKSLPSGVLQAWPDGSPLTLHTLAAQMISVSDNTATDHLLHLLGRGRVEAQLPLMGMADPVRNVPFLSTHEMFRLKETGKSGPRLEIYLAADAGGRRRYLEQELAPLAETGFAGMDMLAPPAVDRVEWFASALDLCRALAWLRDATGAGGAAAPARDVLGINRGLAFADEAWRYVGYKGGSEPGVLAMSWLLQRADGQWFTLAVLWNDPAAVLDENALLTVVQGFLGLVEGH